MARAMGTIPTQADKRRNMILTDQHGRKWFAVIEKETGYPTGLVQPLFEVAHPGLVAPQAYMRFPEDQPGRLFIDYEPWERECTARQEEWERERLRLINTLPGGVSNPILVQELGPRPMSPVPVRAMRQGNKWALGMTDIKPREAEDFFPPPPAKLDESVFTETAPQAFSEVEEVAPPTSAQLEKLLADIDRSCPKELFGAARRNWAMEQLEKLVGQEA